VVFICSTFWDSPCFLKFFSQFETRVRVFEICQRITKLGTKRLKFKLYSPVPLSQVPPVFLSFFFWVWN
jgi:hypothetical protein